MKQRLYGHVYMDSRLGYFFLNVYLRGYVSVCLSIRPSTGVAFGGLPNYGLDFGDERVNAATGMFHLSQI